MTRLSSYLSQCSRSAPWKEGVSSFGKQQMSSPLKTTYLQQNVKIEGVRFRFTVPDLRVLRPYFVAGDTAQGSLKYLCAFCNAHRVTTILLSVGTILLNSKLEERFLFRLETLCTRAWCTQYSLWQQRKCSAMIPRLRVRNLLCRLPMAVGAAFTLSICPGTKKVL